MKIIHRNAIHVPIGSPKVRLAATPQGATPPQADPAKVSAALDALVAALGLPPDASPDDVSGALEAFFGSEAASETFAPPQTNEPQRKAFPGGSSPNAVGASRTREANLAEAKRRGIFR